MPIWFSVLLMLLAPQAHGFVHEQIGRNVDLSSVFRNVEDKEVTFQQLVESPQPILLVPVQMGCAEHCRTHLRGLLDGLKRIRFVPGMHFKLILVSFDPNETPLQAAELLRNLQRLYGRRYVPGGWDVLTGSVDVIQLFTTNLGLSFELNPPPGQIGHTAVAVFLDSNGRIVRYLYGPRYTPTAIKAGLIEAGQDQMGSSYERFIYSLSRYDAKEQRYKILPIKTLAWITLPLFVLWLTVFTVRDFLSRRR